MRLINATSAKLATAAAGPAAAATTMGATTTTTTTTRGKSRQLETHLIWHQNELR